MTKVGDTLTLAELIDRSQSDCAFVTVRVVGGLTTVIYGSPNAETLEYWQAVPETDHLILKRISSSPDATFE